MAASGPGGAGLAGEGAAEDSATAAKAVTAAAADVVAALAAMKMAAAQVDPDNQQFEEQAKAIEQLLAQLVATLSRLFRVS